MLKSQIVIIGAGIIGSMISRELSKYDLDVLVIDKENDVGNKTTNANSAIVHSGYDPVPGTLKAKFNVLGNSMFDELCEQLDVSFQRIGSLTVAIYDEQLPLLKELAERSKQNGVDVKILTPEEVKAMEPNINPEVKGAIFAPTAGIVDPFNLCVHAMENAIDNGVRFERNCKVLDIQKDGDLFKISTSKGDIFAEIVINCAGVYSDKIASLIEGIDWSIKPRKGEYFILDHFKKGFVNHTIFPLPSEKGKGILVSPTSSGNYILGPTSEEILSREDLSTDKPTLDMVRKGAIDMVPTIPFNQVIRVFSGLRATCTRHDFVIEHSKKYKEFINVGGIESPGLVSSPAIAKYVVEELVLPIRPANKKSNYNPSVRKYLKLAKSLENNDLSLLETNPDYSDVFCNCEKVTLGEINDILSRSCPPVSVKGVKRRTRAGFGKCQGGFCQPRIVLLLAKHYGVSPLDIPLDNEGSNILVERIKETN